MSKEIETTTEDSNGNSRSQRRRRKRMYSFYAPLMLSGNAPPELCVYPSQTSALIHQNQSWRSLRGRIGNNNNNNNTNNGAMRQQAPTLEILDGSRSFRL
jgi:hypothetical protein